jgi:eukaryotic-like serine/threonine-protein kinase
VNPLAGLPAGLLLGGDYRIERLLSSGGMGSVYVARQISTDRLRALKVMSPEIVSDPKSHEGFLREARVGSRIQSDYIVEVLAAGVDQDTGLPWLAMELLEGEDLADHVEKRGVPSRSQAVLILEQLFHAMASAHRAGVVHRDLKPENLFLRQARQVGAPQVLKVLDFGIAKILSASVASKQTRSIGTPGWLAPEQCSEGTCTAASDVWALGLLVFYLLTGKPFWLRQHDQFANLHALIYEICLAPIPQASERAKHFGVEDKLPENFDAWFARCLDREQARRFPEAAEAWRALQPLLMEERKQADSAHAPAACAPTLESPSAATDSGTQAEDSESERVRVVPRSVTTGAAVTSPSVRSYKRRRLSQVLALGAIGAIAALAVVVGLSATRGRNTSRTSSVSASSANIQPAAPAASLPIDAGTVQEPREPPNMISIPGGAVRIGQSDQPVKAFRLDKAEVTVAQWDACVAAGTCDAHVDAVQWSEVPRARVKYFSDLCNYRNRKTRGDHPINCVSQKQAQAYCAWNGHKRLPERAEWMVAAFGPRMERKYPWGDREPSPSLLNACGLECAPHVMPVVGGTPLSPFMRRSGFDDKARYTAAVGSYPQGATPEGLMDMAGNVWEWTTTDIVGGGWYETDESMLRAGASTVVPPDVQFPTLGFRCAR